MINRIFPLVVLILISNYLIAQTIDTKHLKLNLKFDWQKKQAFGSADITFSIKERTNKFYLDAGYLSIHSITLNNQTIQFQNNGGDTKNNVELLSNYELKPQTEYVLKIEYNTNYENRSDPNAIWGSFGKGLRFLQPTSTTPIKRNQIWSSGQPNSNKYWYPCNENIADIHTTEIIATIEKPYSVISNGTLISKTENKDQTRTFHYKTERPFPNYLVALVIGEYDDITLHVRKTPIYNLGYPSEKEAVRATTTLIPDMMEFLENLTGYRYPHPQYTQVVVQDYPFPGLVGQHSMSLLSDNYIDDFGVHDDFKYLWDGIAFQSLANQWFGNLIMIKSWNDIWLNDAFAQYFADLYTIKNNSNSEYLLYALPFEKGNVMNDWNNNNHHPIVFQPIDKLESTFNDSYSKFKGTLVLRMLQKEVGDENWWKAIQLYVKTNACQQVTTKDFQQAIEETTHKSYQWFFDQWIYKNGLPKFEISKEYDNAKKQLIIHVNQNQVKDTSSLYEHVDYFKGQIEFEVDNRIIHEYIEPKLENVYTISMRDAPKYVHFNVNDMWLCEYVFHKKKEEYLQQLNLSNDIIAKKIAQDKLVEFALDSTTNTEFKNEIRTSLINEIKSNKYWRYRLYSLSSLRKIISLPYDEITTNLLLSIISTEKSWLKASAISILGNTKDEKYFEIYEDALNDKSDRVINSAAIAIGMTKSKKALNILLNLEHKPSWKNQSRISALNGLEQLKDSAAINYVLTCLKDNSSPRWFLATPTWDYPFAAANTLMTLGKGELGYPILFEKFKISLEEDDLNDIFQLVQLIDILKDKRAKEVYGLLKEKFKNDATLLETISTYEKQFLESLPK